MSGRPAVLKVDIVADAKGVGRGVGDAESKLDRLGRTAARVGKVAAAGLAVGLGAAAVGAFKLAQGAAEDELAATRLAKTLTNVTGATRGQVDAVEGWITAQGKAKGVADDELRPALSRLVTATKDVGEAQKLTSLAMDVSAGTGKSLQQVSEALMRAQNGQVTGLSRLGVATQDAAGNTLTLDQLTKNLADTYGGQATAAANTAAGKWGRLKLQLGELGETLGSKLLPVGNRLAEWALEMAPRVEKLANKAGKVLGPALADVGAFIKDRVMPVAQQLGEFITDRLAPALGNVLTPIINGARAAFGRIGDAIERNREPLAKIGALVRTLSEVFMDKFMPIVGKVVGKGFEVIGTAIGGVVDVLGTLVEWIDKAIGKIEDLIGWAKKIDIPDLDIPFVGGSVGNLTTLAPSLTGGTGPLDGRRGMATAALSGSPSWGAVATAAGTGRLTAGNIDARTYLEVKVDGSGIVDETAVADKLAGVLHRHAQRLGLPVLRGVGVGRV